MSLTEQIKKTLSDHRVVLYMKGSSTFPQCGFSAKVVDILNSYGVEYQSVNVLEDPEIRQAIKVYSDWPTIPQLFIKGELVGGCDIISELHDSGQLEALLLINNTV